MKENNAGIYMYKQTDEHMHNRRHRDKYFSITTTCLDSSAKRARRNGPQCHISTSATGKNLLIMTSRKLRQRLSVASEKGELLRRGVSVSRASEPVGCWAQLGRKPAQRGGWRGGVTLRGTRTGLGPAG